MTVHALREHNTVDAVGWLDWGAAELRDALAWHKANNPDLSASQIEAFKAGHAEAWRRARALATLHRLSFNP